MSISSLKEECALTRILKETLGYEDRQLENRIKDEYLAKLHNE